MAVSSDEVSHESITNGYRFTYTPSSVVGDGEHTVSIEASDNDGNVAESKSTTFTVDTVPPTLNIMAPVEGLVTSSPNLVVAGQTNDVTSSPVTINITLGGVDQGAVSVGGDGSFSKSITLAEGSNVIVIKATDAAEKTTSVTRNVVLDTSVPRIVSATITPNPVDAGQTVLISVEVSG